MIVVLNYNGLADTIRCLESLTRIDYEPFAVVLVDNGSVENPVPAATQAFPGLITIETGQNLGFAGGSNRGLDVACEHGADFVVFLNNDTIVAPTLLRDLVGAFADRPAHGVIGPVINYMEEPATVMTDGVRFNTGPGTVFFQRREVPVDDIDANLVDVDIVNGCCMMARVAVLRQVGGFDESYFIVHEESDLCLRVLRAGYRNGVLGRTLVWHKGSSSFKREGRRLQRYYDTRNLWYLVRTHAGRTSGSRGLMPSAWHYLKYAYYRYATEMEATSEEAASAVLDGLCDSLRNVRGPYDADRTRPRRAVKTVAELVRRTRRSAR